jgi:serine protease AprX
MSLLTTNRVRLTCAVLALLAAASLATPGANRLDRALQQRGSGAPPVRVIIQASRALTSDDAPLLNRPGAALHGRLAADRAAVMTLDAAALDALSNDTRVARVSVDAPVRANVALTQQAVLDPGIAYANSLAASVGSDGSGVTVAVIDSGVAHVPGLNGRIDAVYDAINNVSLPVAKSFDYFGHGTHVSSIIAGRNTATGFSGMAPGARLISCRALDANGNGYTSDVIRALDWCVSQRVARNIRVVNLSLSHPPYESWKTDPLCQAVQRATEAGILVVCSAGNWGAYGDATIGSPGNSPYALTVGAVNAFGTPDRSDDAVAAYSSRGPSLGDLVMKPDVVAPGNRILALAAPGSTLRREPGAVARGPYVELSGTSMAAPVVAGIAALMLSHDPSATPGELKARLMVTAYKMPGTVWSRGAGMVNAFAAVWSSTSTGAPVSTLSPVCVPSEDGTYDLVDPLSNGSIIWADRVVWGDGPVPGPQDPTALATRVVWGDGPITCGDEMTSATRVVWGDGPIAGPADGTGATRVVWGDGPLPDPGGTTTATRVVWGDSPLDPGGDISATRVVWGDGPSLDNEILLNGE